MHPALEVGAHSLHFIDPDSLDRRREILSIAIRQLVEHSAKVGTLMPQMQQQMPE